MSTRTTATGTQSKQPLHDAVSVPVPVPEPVRAPAPARPAARTRLSTLRAHVGTVAGGVILAVVLWQLGTGVLLDGLRRIDAATVLEASVIGAVTTVCSAWRWQLVAQGLGIRLPLGPAVADYYRALFLNAALPGGVVGDVHRAVRHGRNAGDMRRGVNAVVLERVAGQVALAVCGSGLLLVLPSPVRDTVRGSVPPVALGAVGVLAVVVAVRMNRAPSSGGGALHSVVGDVRRGLLSRRGGPGIALSSAVVLAGHLAMFVLAARIAGCAAPVAVLLPPAVLALLAMGLPLNMGGFGPREGVTAWAFGAAGLGAGSGVAVAVVYGVLSFVASLPGVVVLVARRWAGPRADPCTNSRVVPEAVSPAVPEAVPPVLPPSYPAAFPPARPGSSPEVSSPTYAPKQSTRAASSSCPFSAEPREGRPMTPDSV